jgi:hypothetical protein
MSVLRICDEPGCQTRTLGLYCVAHETLPTRQATLRQRRMARRAAGRPDASPRKLGSVVGDDLDAASA